MSAPVSARPRPGTAVDAAVDAAARALFARQRADGSWQDHLPSSAVSTATSLVALHTADPTGCDDLVTAAGRWLLETQQADGGWGDAVSSPSTLNATVLAVAALRVLSRRPTAGLPPAGELDRAAALGWEWCERAGGLEAVRDPLRCTLSVIAVNHLALTGLVDPGTLGRLPFELVLLPRRLRQKLSFTVPGLMAFGLMHARTLPGTPARRALARAARPAALRYLDGIQRLEGYVGGYQESPLMASVVCFGLARGELGAPIVARCVRYLAQTQRSDGSWPVNRDLEFSATMFLTVGLTEAGYGSDDRLRPTERWLRRCQRTVRFFPTGAPSGGWGWSLPSGWPNTDDTTSGLLALQGFGHGPDDHHVQRGARWLLRMQNRNGSWSCFARNGHVSMDAPSAEFTAHALLSLTGAGYGLDHPQLARAVRWLVAEQRPDGGYPSLWYRPLTAGTGQVLEALGRAGLGSTPTARRAVDWLRAAQLPDGGWGDGRGSQASVEETSWALLGLVGAGEAASPAAAAGADWLVGAQREDGLWEPTLLGVYFLGLLYHDDHIANGYALQALGRWRAAVQDASP